MGIAVGVVLTALQWPFRTALFPVTIGTSVFLMASIELLMSLFEKKEPGRRRVARDWEHSEKVDPVLARRRTTIIFAWIAGFFLMILFFGFPVAAPLLVFSYLKLQSNEKWGITLLLTAAALVFFFGLFVWLLDTYFAEGLIIRGLKAI